MGIYQTPDLSLKEINCPETLFEDFKVSKRYQLDELNDIVKEAFKTFPISEKNVEHAALTAKNYAVFEDVSKILIDKCHNTMKNLPITLESIVNVAAAAKRPQCEAVSEHLMQRCNGFLRENLKTADDVFDFILKTRENQKADPDLIYGILKTKPLLSWCTLKSFAPEFQIVKGLLFSIPKLSKQWRIIHSFKPTSYIQGEFSGLYITGLQYELSFRFRGSTYLHLPEGDMVVQFKETKHFKRPAIGVWTTLQVSHQMNEEGKPFFNIVVGGVEVHKEEIPLKTGITDVNVYESNPVEYQVQKGCIKNIIIETME